MRILVSACLMGISCRYDGKCIKSPWVESLSKKHDLIPFCPEVYGGLPTPREPAELRDDCVCTQSGVDVTAFYQKGAEEAVWLVKTLGITFAILKDKSPSCGVHAVYDGTFTATLRRNAVGFTTKALIENGVRVLSENEIDKIE